MIKTHQKQEILLIHGYGAGIKVPKINFEYGKDMQFDAFRGLVESNIAETFSWSQPSIWKVGQYLNPFEHLKLFNNEKKKIENAEMMANLAILLAQKKYKTIVAHSLGCYLLLEYLKTHDLPPSVQKILFVQACVPKKYKISESTKSKLKHLKTLNLWCPWDNALLAYFLTSGNLTHGLTGFSKQHLAIQNRFFPLYKRLNLHRSSICDPKILEIIEKY
jgi:hypothetical protein